ncbi:MAG TPA: IS21 family transposase [Beutenbergiaceae bacterium]|nr:IS21 family transposase [Beutenbergiaceae bacterium]
MTDYRQLMLLLLEKRPYRQIAVMQGCSQRTIAKARRVLDDQGFTTAEQVEGLSLEDLDRLFVDGRKGASDAFVPINLDRVTKKRLGRKKAPLKVLWAHYLQEPALPGQLHYGYERFCQIAAEHVRVRDLTAPITHVPGRAMQVDWAGTSMFLTDPITRSRTRVSVFVATWPYSGLVYARGYTDEKQPSWLDGHRRAFEHAGGVPLMVIPDNTSTASNQIVKGDRARDVNVSYAEFLEHYSTAAVPTKESAPKQKAGVEAGVKVVTNWVIHYLADRVFVDLDDLNEAVEERVEWINHRTPFRNEDRSRWAWFTEAERVELLALPAQRWEPVTWRKAKVHRDWHIQLDTIKYSVPHTHAGSEVQVRIIGEQLDVITDGEIVATHRRGTQRGQYVTNPEHAPAYLEDTHDLWTRGYFLRQASKAGPATTAALTRLLDSKRIEAQGFRSCMNILNLGKRSGRQLLERACEHLVESDPHRQISYTGVKNTIAAIRTEDAQRPSTSGPHTSGDHTGAGRKVSSRDTSGAHLSGPAAFTLEALTSNASDEKGA